MPTISAWIPLNTAFLYKVRVTMSGATRFELRLPWALGVIFLISAIGLAYEVLLTRLFSVVFQYHYVFFVASISIAGLSLGAALATLVTRNKNLGLQWGDLSYAVGLVALLLAGTAVVIARLRFASLVGVALVAALSPFVGIGFLSAVLFAAFAGRGAMLYAADLVGGACGIVAALGMVGWLGAFDAIFTLSALAAGLAFLLAYTGGARSLQARMLGLLALAMAVLLVNRSTRLIDFSPAQLTDAPPDKTLMQVLQDPEASLLETRWDAFARVDMVATGDARTRYVFTDAGAGSIMVRYGGEPTDVAWLRREIAYLPFMLNADSLKNVLVLGAGAGKDVLMAHLAGAESITAVEINPTLVDLTRDAADYNGNVFDLSGVEVHVMDGRNYVERSDVKYDLIYANVVYSQAAAPVHSALSEGYIFTREALSAYWHHLSGSGRIGFVTHHGIEGLRLMVAALDMLQHEGMSLQEALDHVALASLRSGDAQTRTSVLLVARQPLITNAATGLISEAHARDAGWLYLPAYQELGLQALVEGAMTLDAYIAANDDYNYTPTTDDSPFFYQFNPGLPATLAELLTVSGLSVFAYLSWLIFFFVRRDRMQWKRVALATHFALLGAGFMLVEIPLIQRFNLLLGQPVLALVTVVSALLISGGLGSLFSSRLSVHRLPQVIPLFALAVGVGIALSFAVYPALIRWALPFDLPVRVIVVIAALLPLGFLMGTPFPSGLRIAHHADPLGVAAFWGVNAITSVLGSALAMVIAISSGFSRALVFGVALYVLVAVVAYITWSRLVG